MGEFGHVPVVCLDTNILIQMKGLTTGNKEEMKSMENAGVTESVGRLYKLIKHGKISAIITPTVLKEVLHGVSYYGFDLVDFIRDHNILIFEVDREHRESWRVQTNNLAKAYCTNLKADDISKLHRIYKDHSASYSKSVFGVKILSKNKIVPINDARIMAEATYLGLPLITNNTKDFHHDNRANVISYINRRKGFKYTSRPYTSEEFLEYIHQRKVYPKINKNLVHSLVQSNESEFLM